MLRPEQTRFTLTDDSGNSVMFIKEGPEDGEEAEAYQDGSLSKLQRAVKLAARLRDFHLDDRAAAKVLDTALARPGEALQPTGSRRSSRGPS